MNSCTVSNLFFAGHYYCHNNLPIVLVRSTHHNTLSYCRVLQNGPTKNIEKCYINRKQSTLTKEYFTQLCKHLQLKIMKVSRLAVAFLSTWSKTASISSVEILKPPDFTMSTLVPVLTINPDITNWAAPNKNPTLVDLTTNADFQKQVSHATYVQESWYSHFP